MSLITMLSMLKRLYQKTPLLIPILTVLLFTSTAAVAGVSDLWDLAMSQDATAIQKLAGSHMWIAMALCFISGILTSFTPCVYPVIPITINIFAKSNENSTTPAHRKFNSRSFGLASIYVGGMCTTYTILGLISGLTGSLFGNLLQSSYMLGFLALLFFVLALGQFGLFEMSLPSSWQTKLLGMGSATSYTGIFLMGLFAGLIVSPCVGPIIAGILAFVFESSNALLGGLYFFCFSLGLGMLFLVIGGFSGALAALPRSGNWMSRINKLLGLLLLVASFYYGNLWIKQMGWFSSPTVSNASQIAWINSESEALQQSTQKQLPLMIDFTAEWCESCHVIDKTVLQDPQVVERVSSNYIAARIDVTSNSEENTTLLQRYKVYGLPAIVFVRPNGEVLTQPRVNGVIGSDDFLKMLDRIHKSN